MKRLLITVLLLSGAVFANGGGGGGGGQNQRQSQNQMDQRQSQNQTEQRQSSDPAQRMKKLMTSYDADKDGVLSLDELTQAMGEIQMSRTQKPSQGEQSEQRSEPQEADKIAALMIEKFSSGQKGLTAGDLTRALKEIARQR